MARRILGTVGQLRIEKPAPVALSSTDVALARMNLQLWDVEQCDALLVLMQVVAKPNREQRRLRGVPRVLSVPGARRQKQDVVPLLEMADEARARLHQALSRGAHWRHFSYGVTE
jgi:hypothetical protein